MRRGTPEYEETTKRQYAEGLVELAKCFKTFTLGELRHDYECKLSPEARNILVRELERRQIDYSTWEIRKIAQRFENKKLKAYVCTVSTEFVGDEIHDVPVAVALTREAAEAWFEAMNKTLPNEERSSCGLIEVEFLP